MIILLIGICCAAAATIGIPVMTWYIIIAIADRRELAAWYERTPEDTSGYRSN